MEIIIFKFRNIYKSIFPNLESDAVIIGFSFFIITCSVFAASIFNSISLIVLPIVLFGYLIIKHESFIIYLYLAIIPLTNFMLWDYKAMINYPLVAIFCLIWFIRKFTAFKLNICISKPLLIFYAFFMLVIILSALNSGFTKESQAALIRFTAFFPFIFIIYDLYKPRNTIIIIFAISIPLLINIVYLLIDFSSAKGLLGLLNLYRNKPGGYFPNVNVYSGALICVIPFWICLSIWSRNKKIRLASGILAVLMVIALFMTNARASIIGFILALFMISIWAKKVKYFIFVLLTLLAIYIFVPQVNAIISIAMRTETGTNARSEIWLNTLKIIEKYPLLGIGKGNYADAYKPYFDTVYKLNFYGSVVGHAHNQLLYIMAELGFPGLILVSILYYLPLWAGFKAIKKMTNIENKAFLYGIIGGIVSLFGRSLFEASSIINDGSLYPEMIFWILIVMLLKINFIAKGDQASPFFEK